MSNHRLIEENRSHWDKLAPIHARGSGALFYRIEEFLAGESKLAPWEIDEIGPVTGKSLLHLQCHIGLDTLSWAREGASVTGLDFSTASLQEARTLAKQIGVEARFVEAFVQNAAEVLDHKVFDIIYTGRGAICWLPELDVWAEQCANLCKPGGIFYMEESHPTLDLFDFKPDSGVQGVSEASSFRSLRPACLVSPSEPHQETPCRVRGVSWKTSPSPFRRIDFLGKFDGAPDVAL